MISNLTFFLPKNIRWMQWTGCLATTLLMVVIGLMIGWTFPNPGRLRTYDSSLQVIIDETFWTMITVHSLGRIMGSVLGGTSVHYFGGKRTLVLSIYSMLCCWTFVIIADSAFWLYSARLANGLSHGATFTSFPLYLGEVSSADIRGALISLATIGHSLGILIGTVTCVYFPMSQLAWMSLAPTVATILIFIWIPESPHHLIQKSRTQRAWRSILKYNPGADVQIQFDSLKNFLSTTSPLTFADRLRELNSPPNRKSSVVAVMLFVFLQTSALSTLTFYSEIILTKGRFTAVAPSTMVIMLNSIGILSGLGAMCLADKCGRRILWTTASTGSCVALIMIGAHFRFLNYGSDPVKLQWLLVTALIIWQVFTYVGLNPIPNMILGELFSPNVKSMVASLGNVIASVLAMLYLQSYETMINAMGETCVFFIHAIIMLLATFFGWTFLSETKGKSLQEIQDSLMKQ